MRFEDWLATHSDQLAITVMASRNIYFDCEQFALNEYRKWLQSNQNLKTAPAAPVRSSNLWSNDYESIPI